MNKILFTLLSSLIFLSSGYSEEQNLHIEEIKTIKLPNPREFFITSEGVLTPEIVALLKLDNLYSEGDTLKDAINKTQSSWVQVQSGTNNKERIDLRDTPKWMDNRGNVLEILSKMGLLQERTPTLLHYDYAICHGAFLDSVQSRLANLIKQWKNGIRFDSLIFLTGERYLRKGPGEKDDFFLLCDATKAPYPFKKRWRPNPDSPYETEYDMVKLVWEQAEIPKDMAEALEGKIIFINALKGEFPRPSTHTTVRKWLNDYNPTSGTILASSSPIVWPYQHFSTSVILGPQFKLETIAQESEYLTSNRYNPGMVSVIFDSLAKCLYLIDKTIENQ